MGAFWDASKLANRSCKAAKKYAVEFQVPLLGSLMVNCQVWSRREWKTAGTLTAMSLSPIVEAQDAAGGPHEGSFGKPYPDRPL